MKLNIYLSIVLIVALWGCVEREPTTFPAQRMGMQADMSLDEADQESRVGEGSPTPTMDGTWLVVHESSLCIIGVEQVSTSDYLVEITQEGFSLKEKRRLCAVDLSPVLGLTVTVPAAAFESVDFVQLDRGVLTGLAQGAGYTSSLEVALWGMQLKEPYAEVLPTSVDDVRVLDADEDGFPGVTFDVGEGTCQRYAVQRQLIQYQGTFMTPHRVEGTSVALTEAVALDGSSALCKSAPALLPNDRYNRFIMVRVDGRGGTFDADVNGDGEITCGEIREVSVMLNPGREPERDFCK